LRPGRFWRVVNQLLKLEGLAVFLAGLYFYFSLGGSWLLLLILILVPDVGMVGYLKDKKVGAFTYNLFHNYVLALGLVLIGLVLTSAFLTDLGLILAIHIGIDRFLGFGLKYPTNFKDTHLQKV
jgi:hypothetical protein